jgi:hypothetical protein
MKLSRIAGLTVLALILTGMAFFSGLPVSGQAVSGPNDGVIFQPWQNAQPLYSLGTGPGGQNPEVAKLLNEEGKFDREAHSLAQEYARSSNETDRAKTKAKLTDVLGKEFDMQQKRRNLELESLEAQVKKLRELMKKRNDARTVIVDKRLDQLVSQAEGLGWTTTPGGGNRGNFSQPLLIQQR